LQDNQRTESAHSADTDQRRLIVRAARALLELGLVEGTAGNISLREGARDSFLITPTAMDYRVMVEEDIVRVGNTSGKIEGRRRPSSECELHARIYRGRQDVNAVIHHHSLYVTSLAAAHKSIPDILDEAVDLTPIPIIDYAPSGSSEPACKAAVGITKGCNAVLLANHGIVVVGESLEEAFERSVKAERVSQVFVWAQALGGPDPLERLTAEESRQVLKRYKQARAEQEIRGPAEALRLYESVSLADLMKFTLKSCVTFSSLLHALLLQKLRR